MTNDEAIDLSLGDLPIKSSQQYANWLALLDQPFSRVQLTQLLFFKLIFLRFNKNHNLASQNHAGSFDIKNAADSLAALPWMHERLKPGAKILDLGSGGGFPGIPLAIMLSDYEFTLLDATHKKVAFLEQASQKLKLKNCNCICARVEDWSNRPRNQGRFDAIIIRAVAALDLICDLSYPLLKKNGYWLFWKTKNVQEEMAALGILSPGLLEHTHIFGYPWQLKGLEKHRLIAIQNDGVLLSGGLGRKNYAAMKKESRSRQDTSRISGKELD